MKAGFGFSSVSLLLVGLFLDLRAGHKTATAAYRRDKTAKGLAIAPSEPPASAAAVDYFPLRRKYC